ncbi:hypothetical protein L195_g039062 [Trifolium pratense]|uniref:Uncharacterized protein n=1 Tax=Trifolium pratense TaxID=57577 RepID=A0A2K3LWW2_TRIPR|nr:hypothetical protein L195_g039062 [Trifolium pratense]
MDYMSTQICYGIDHVYPYETTSRVFDLAKQFQKFLASQPDATSVSSIKGLTQSNLSVMTADDTLMPVAGVGIHNLGG